MWFMSIVSQLQVLWWNDHVDSKWIFIANSANTLCLIISPSFLLDLPAVKAECSDFPAPRLEPVRTDLLRSEEGSWELEAEKQELHQWLFTFSQFHQNLNFWFKECLLYTRVCAGGCMQLGSTNVYEVCNLQGLSSLSSRIRVCGKVQSYKVTLC